MHQLLEAPVTPATERRFEPRYRTAFATVCRFECGPGGRSVGLVRDISTSGIGLLLPHPPACGDELRGELVTEGSAAAPPVTMRVAHVRRLSTGDYFVGARFRRPLSVEAIAVFVTPVVERRAVPAGGTANSARRHDASWRNRG